MNQQFARLSEITTSKDKPGRYPISPATWWRWVASGYAPAGLRLGPNKTAWSISSLEAFDRKVAAGDPPDDAEAIAVTPAIGKPEAEPRKLVNRRQVKRADLATV